MIVTVACGKGGVGKTTTAVTLAHGWALHRGTDALLVDLDPLGQAAVGLGVEPWAGAYDALVRQVYEPREVRPGLRLLAGNSETKWAETFLSMRQRAAGQVADDLVRALRPFGVLVFDTPPGGLMQDVALLAADVTVVPATLDFLGIQGLTNLLALRSALGAGGQVVAVPSMMDRRLRRHRNLLDELREFGKQNGFAVADPVPLRDEMRSLWQNGQTVWEGSGNGAQQDLSESFAALVKQVEELAYGTQPV